MFFYVNLSVISSDKSAETVIGSCLPDSGEFPFAVVTVKLTEYHRGHTVVIFGQVIAAKLLVLVGVNKPDECILYHTEILSAGSCLVDIDHNDYLGILSGEL